MEDLEEFEEDLKDSLVFGLGCLFFVFVSAVIAAFVFSSIFGGVQ